MKVFDLNEMTAAPYEQRGKNVFYQAKEFKTRIIELPPDGKMPTVRWRLMLSSTLWRVRYEEQ